MNKQNEHNEQYEQEKRCLVITKDSLISALIKDNIQKTKTGLYKGTYTLIQFVFKKQKHCYTDTRSLYEVLDDKEIEVFYSVIWAFSNELAYYDFEVSDMINYVDSLLKLINKYTFMNDNAKFILKIDRDAITVELD